MVVVMMMISWSPTDIEGNTDDVGGMEQSSFKLKEKEYPFN